MEHREWVGSPTLRPRHLTSALGMSWTVGAASNHPVAPRLKGSERNRFPVAAKMALPIAGASGGTPGSTEALNLLSRRDRPVKRQSKYDCEAYKRRNLIEHCVKQFRRIATHYQKTARAFVSMLCIAAARFRIKTVNTAFSHTTKKR